MQLSRLSCVGSSLGRPTWSLVIGIHVFNAYLHNFILCGRSTAERVKYIPLGESYCW
uniref:Uncharacterized protein n=1 Tax=Arundo donax TaxID=35708 RepID=A0A0A9FME1_ARUDO